MTCAYILLLLKIQNISLTKKTTENLLSVKIGGFFYIPVKCGCCIECRKEKQREWRVRLEEELRTSFGYFTTLTISQEKIKEIESTTGLKWEENPNRNCNKSLKIISRTGKKRYRKEYKTLVRYGNGREKRQNTFARYILWPKKCGINQETLEIRVCVYWGIL